MSGGPPRFRCCGFGTRSMARETATTTAVEEENQTVAMEAVKPSVAAKAASYAEASVWPKRFAKTPWLVLTR